MPADERWSAAEAWLQRARDDLRSARIRLRHREEMSAEIASFHAQQAAEKALKALLISRGVAIPKTHDLEELHRLVGGAFKPGADELASLTPYAVQFRYPDWPVQPTPTDEDVSNAIDVADTTVKAVERQLAPTTGQ